MHVWDALLTIGISAAPVIELRGGIPFALSQGFSPGAALGLALLGNLAVIPLLLWGLNRMEKLFMRWACSRRILERTFARSRRKGRWVERWGSIGLLLLVAIPLPGTGAWTGAIVSRLLGLPFRRSLLWIALGVFIAGLLVLLASLGVIEVLGLHDATST